MTGTPTIELRAMTEADLPRVHGLEVAASPDPWSEELLAGEFEGDRSDRLWLVAEGGPETAPGAGHRTGSRSGSEPAIIGFGGVLQVLDEAHVMNLVVDPDRRRTGVASRLLAALLLAVGDRGAVAATLEVRVGNAAAIALYHRFGFESVGRRPHYYANGEDAEIMWLHHLHRPDVQTHLLTIGGLDG